MTGYWMLLTGFPHLDWTLDPVRCRDAQVCFSVFLLGRAVGLAWRYWGPEGPLNEMAEKNHGLQQLLTAMAIDHLAARLMILGFDGCSSCNP